MRTGRIGCRTAGRSDLFTILEKHNDIVERVTFWGLNERRSWRTGQNPLIFDIDNQCKPAYEAIVNVAPHPEP
jgi:GH35 family endo-1,4-beta-xylanase